MRFRQVPESLLSSSARISVITTLLREGDRVWTGSGLARAAGVTPRWAIVTLRALEAEGVVHASSAAPSMIWAVNRDHLLVELLADLAEVDRKAQAALLGEVAKAVSPARPRKVLLFGSTARGDEEPGSDVDVLVVVADARSKRHAQDLLARTAQDFFRRFGNRLAPIVLTQREFEQRRGRGFVKAALDHGIWIKGGPGRG